MAKRARQSLITLTDEKGVDHDFEPLELFTVGKKNFALLQPAKTKKNEVAIFKFTMDKQGNPKTFVAPSEKEFAEAVDALEGDVEVEGDDAACCCCCDCDEPAPKKAAKKKPAAKKAAKKPAKKSKK
jgi:uncharacterized protein YrzB (UPF0473 family)